MAIVTVRAGTGRQAFLKKRSLPALQNAGDGLYLMHNATVSMPRSYGETPAPTYAALAIVPRQFFHERLYVERAEPASQGHARHLADPVLFGINTGCREQEICRLRWDWKVEVPESKTSVFILPGT